MVGTWVSIIPPLVAIVMVLLTRRVLLSLGLGIVSGALIATSFVPIATLTALWESMTVSVWDWDGQVLNQDNIYIILFILLLGIITTFISLSGGTKAFAEWAMRRIKTKRSANLLTVGLGIAIFVDDYFNSLAVGQIARPITDRHNISRAKLAYFIDSTSAPICVVSPVSSWGAYLIGLLGIMFAGTSISHSPLSAFVLMAPMNFYVVATLSFVLFFAWTNINLFSMRKHEQLAEEGQLFDPKKEIPGQLKEEFPTHTYGRVFDLIGPILILIIGTVSMMVMTGYRASVEADVAISIWSIFEHTNVPFSLVIGGLAGTFLSIGCYLRQLKINASAEVAFMGQAVVKGIQTMIPAVLILVFAWALSDLIDTLETGLYLSEVVLSANIAVGFLPAILFVLAGVMAFSTGTSWGSFGILLPIAGKVMLDAAPDLLLPALAAVLAGAVFGDHCSPISDTTILSATGAGCNHMDHVATQLPYALMSAVIATAGYVVLGITGSVWFGLAAVILILGVVFPVLLMRQAPNGRQFGQSL